MGMSTSFMLTGLLLMLFLICALAIYFLARLRFKAQNNGSFNVAWRAHTGDPWRAGVCHYSEDFLKWYRVISLRWGSNRRWERADFEILEAAIDTEPGSDFALAILHCRAPRQGFSEPDDFWLAMNEHDYSGLVSWKESAPPRTQMVY
ncbi:DUF2550 domain-containing protein [Mobiluncus curtisii]|uniref:DUF2550 family protein n=4 Tax=Actinomycetaceae TaxID=2049 RepID=D6ZL24_MOBCV|nr:DUF2550 domain-containing protein [Mobiluncus holmesii]ADI67423.1 hypothetical protein HMPREF0573_11104 [Mobiluncus curtisii ATCC 43063]EFU81344.1 hypothetical protein HMPREF0576_1186 [Mobiluncus holmesii ATCC 35242]MCV0020942.1 DUF2550 family protein [Mobiluncus curtisii]NMW47455.1 DUF2550 family protein [Mobiluncus curtisii]QQU08844.1 DUF2550 domain-containing protein [Mobiluncus curtisii]